MMKKITKDSLMSFLYIVSMVIAFTTRYGDYHMGYYPQIIIGIIWVIIAIVYFLMNMPRNSEVGTKDLLWAMKLFFLPHVIIHLYTIGLMILGEISWSYFSTNMTVYIPTLLALVSMYLFGIRSFKYNCIALVGSWGLSVGVSLVTKGIMIFPHAIMQAYVDSASQLGGLTDNYLELHDLVLATGYVLVYYLVSQVRMTKKHRYMFFAALIIMVLGMKRASVLGIALVGTFHLITRCFQKKTKYRLCVGTGYFAFLVCFMFIYILSEGSRFYDFLSELGINAMGREHYYKAIMKYAEFKPSFLGIGRNVVSQLLSTKLAYLKVGGVHSDIIKMYVENGFILFALWLLYYLIHNTIAYKNRFGNMEAIIYFEVLIYTFSLYLTDNVENYYICQIFSIVIPLTYALTHRAETKDVQHDVLEKSGNRGCVDER